MTLFILLWFEIVFQFHDLYKVCQEHEKIFNPKYIEYIKYIKYINPQNTNLLILHVT